MDVPVLAGVVAIAVAGAADLTDVRAVVGRHLEACGGAPRLRAISSTREVGTITVKDGTATSTGAALSEEKRPNKSRAERTVYGVHAVWAFDGTTSWGQRDGGDPQELPEDLAKDLAANEFDHFLLDHDRRGMRVELLDPAALETGPAYKLKVTQRDGAVRLSYIDKATFLEVRRDYMDTDGSTSQQWFRGHKAFAGVVRPTIFEMFYPATRRRVVVTLARVEINPQIDDSRFRAPRDR